MVKTKSKSRLITLPNKLLRQTSQKVGIVGPKIKDIVDEMEATTLAWEDSREHEVGVALAAIQLGELLRIIILRNDINNKADRSFSVFINPVITKYEGEIEEDFEGCLSVKNLYGKVPRHTKIRIKAKDLRGKEFRVTAEGFLARTFQHEIDHTNGKLFIDLIKDSPDAFYKLLPDGNLEKMDHAKIKKSRILW